MAQQNTTTAKTNRTSTGIPIKQSFTPPVAEAEARKRGWPSRVREHVFHEIFPEKAKTKLPISITINQPLEKVRAALQDIHNFPLFLEGLEKVEGSESPQSKWFFKDDPRGSLDVTLSKEFGENVFVWQAEDAAGLDYTLAVALEKAQADRGTVVRAMSSYDSKGAELLAKAEKLFGKDAATLAKISLQRFKAYCETGNVPTIEGQPSGRDEDSEILSKDTHSSTLKH